MKRATIALFAATGGVVAATAAATYIAVAVLPERHIMWVLHPLFGFVVAATPSETLGYGYTALSLVLAAVIVVYRLHCVGPQPGWAIVLGWAMASAGAVIGSAEPFQQGSATLTVDVNHFLWPVGFVETLVGCAFSSSAHGPTRPSSYPNQDASGSPSSPLRAAFGVWPTGSLAISSSAGR